MVTDVDFGQPGDWFNLALVLADEADALTRAGFRHVMDIDTKDDGTYVTETDQAVERLIRAAVASAFPSHEFLGEEYGGQVDADRPTWIVDPIDGTNNFVSGNPVFATLISVEYGEYRMAVISAPALSARWDGYIGPQGHHAIFNGGPMKVSERSLATGQVSFGGLQYFAESGRAGLVTRLTSATRRQRGFGDFWQHCLVAQGSLEVAVEAAVNAWDLAAVRTIVQAAGGRFTDLHGNDTIHAGHALSSNGLVHDEVLAMAAVDS